MYDLSPISIEAGGCCALCDLHIFCMGQESWHIESLLSRPHSPQPCQETVPTEYMLLKSGGRGGGGGGVGKKPGGEEQHKNGKKKQHKKKN